MSSLLNERVIFPTQMLINGQLQTGRADTFQVINPATGETLIALNEADAGQIADAVAAAEKAFRRGRARPPKIAPPCCYKSPIAFCNMALS